MKKSVLLLIVASLLMAMPDEMFSQPGVMKELGIDVGGLTNFPANKNYLKEDMGMFYASPYIRAGRHEFSVGMIYPLSTHALVFHDNMEVMIDPRPGFLAGYKFYVFNPAGRENLFIHYKFEYLRFKKEYSLPGETETDMYINNVIGLGYNLFFDMNARFGLFYTLDYVISQQSYKNVPEGHTTDNWVSHFVWNNLSTHIGFSFKITSLGKKH